MKNSQNLDQPFVPLAVALRTMLTKTEAKMAAAVPGMFRGISSGKNAILLAQVTRRMSA